MGGQGCGAEANEARVLAAMRTFEVRPAAGWTAQLETKVPRLLMESLSVAASSDGFYTRIFAGEEAATVAAITPLLHRYRPESID